MDEFLEVFLSVIAFIAMVAFVVFLGFKIFVPVKTTMKISGFAWERNVEIEKSKICEESGWNVPNGAKVTDSEERVYEYEKKVFGYEYESEEVEYEDGSYKVEYHRVPIYEEVPIYRRYYYYDIKRWFHERDVYTSGNDKDAYWGEFLLSSDERVGQKSESYKITGITKDENTKTMNIDYDVWKDLNMYDTVKIKIYSFGNVTLYQ